MPIEGRISLRNMVRLSSFVGDLAMKLTVAVIERVAGKDYSQGYKTYGFAAPFMSEKQAEQDKGRVQAVH